MNKNYSTAEIPDREGTARRMEAYKNNMDMILEKKKEEAKEVDADGE